MDKINNRTTNVVIENSTGNGKWEATFKLDKKNNEYQIVFSKREKTSAFDSLINFFTGAKHNRNLAAKHLASLNAVNRFENMPSIKDANTNRITNNSLDGFLKTLSVNAGNTGILRYEKYTQDGFDLSTKRESVVIKDKDFDTVTSKFSNELYECYDKNCSPVEKKLFAYQISAAIAFVKDKPTEASKDDISAGITLLRLIFDDTDPKAESTKDFQFGNPKNYTKDHGTVLVIQLEGLMELIPDLSDPSKRKEFDEKFTN